MGENKSRGNYGGYYKKQENQVTFFNILRVTYHIID